MPRGGPRLRTPDGKLNQVGVRVQDRRLETHVKQDELCARIAEATAGQWVPAWQDISRIENGARIVSDLEVLVLAAVLSCSAEWLISGNGEPK